MLGTAGSNAGDRGRDV